MAPLPHNNTGIYFVDYSSAGLEHTFEVRASAPGSPAGLAAAVDAFLTAFESTLFLMTITGVRFQGAGQNFANPVITGLEGDTYGGDPGTIDSSPIALNFVGRSTQGRRVRLMVFTYASVFSGYRLTAAESTAIQAAVNVLNGTTNFFLAIDGIAPIWYPYANVLVNAYWQRQVRA